jgi:hypothetical protein
MKEKSDGESVPEGRIANEKGNADASPLRVQLREALQESSSIEHPLSRI